MKCLLLPATCIYCLLDEILDQIYLMSRHFKYLNSIIQKNEEINNDVNYRIQADWLKWRSAIGDLCDRNIPLWLRENFIEPLLGQLCYMA